MSENNTVGKYFRIISSLGGGGFGQTFLAEDTRSSDLPKCVLKQLKPQSNDPNVVSLAGRLFAQEVKTLYQIGAHPQIPSIIAHFEENNEFYFVQEYIDGHTFAQEMELGKIYNQTQVFEIAKQLLEILSFVHGQGVIHRDLKPSNLINRAYDQKVVLIDFGAVKEVRTQRLAQSNQPPQNTIAIGSDGYMPMEQLAGFPTFSSDIYAVGMFAVHLLTQTHPTQLRQNPRTGEWIWQDKTSVNPYFAEVLSRMIRLDFRQRFQNAGEVLQTLRGFNLNAQPRNFPPSQPFNQPNQFIGQPQFNQPLPPQAQFQPPDLRQQNNFPHTVAEPIYPQNQPIYQSQPISPPPIQNRQAALISQYPQPNQTQIATRIAPYPISERKPKNNESITLGSLAYDDLGSHPIVRSFFFLLVFVLCLWLLANLLF